LGRCHRRCVALISLSVTNYFSSRGEARAKETTFKIDCYQKFINAFFGLAEHPSLRGTLNHLEFE